MRAFAGMIVSLIVVVTAAAMPARASNDPAAPPPPPPPPPTATPPAAPPAATSSTAATADPDLTPDKVYRHGKSLYEYGDCAGTLNVLAPLAVPGKLQDEHDQLEVHHMLGVCYALGDKQIEAAREFSSLLTIDPDFDLDGFHNPPAAVDIFTRQKDAMKAQLEELRRAREKAKQSQDEDKGVFLVERNTVVRDVPLAVSFMPFGLAQSANGETTLAVIVGAVQGVSLAATVGSFWGSMYYLGVENKPEPQAVKTGEQNAYYTLLTTEVIAAMAFAISYGFGAGEALWNREDHVVIEKKESKRELSPEEAAALRKSSARAPPAATTTASTTP